jgi:hypothetical protein
MSSQTVTLDVRDDIRNVTDIKMEAILTREPKQSFTGQIAKLLLPKEHGSWSLALEPLVLGLLVAPSAAGDGLAVAALAGFFLRRPLKSLLREPFNAQRKQMMICAFVLIVIAMVGLLLAAGLGGTAKLWPLAPAAMAGIAFAWFDSRNEARAEAAELAGATAFGILPAAFGALAGWSTVESVALAMIMLARSVPTIMFVRTYNRDVGRLPVVERNNQTNIVGYLGRASILSARMKIHEEENIRQKGWASQHIINQNIRPDCHKLFSRLVSSRTTGANDYQNHWHLGSKRKLADC